MKAISSTDNPVLRFGKTEGSTKKMKAFSNRIGWLHAQSAVAGAKFDITIKDGLGRIKYEKKDCGNETEQYGELLNLPTFLGEELEIEVKNLRGVDDIAMFLN